MHAAAPLCRRTLSRGAALMRVVIAVVVLAAVWFLIAHLFPSREARLMDFIDDSRAALVDGRQAEFMAAFDPAVSYQRGGGLAAIQKDWARYRAAGVVTAKIVSSTVELDETGADVELDVVLIAGLASIGTRKVRMRVAEREDGWKVTSLTWH